MDPLAGSSWSAAGTVAGFARAAPNANLLRLGEDLLARRGGGVALDIGCGAARNALPLVQQGWRVVGLDLSWPMLVAARDRAHAAAPARRPLFVQAPMERLPVRDASVDLVVAHGIWNLAPTVAVFRAAVAEAGRVAAPGAALFLFTFSRHTLAPGARPVPGEPFVFTQFAGTPQVFLTEGQIAEELATAGFVADGPIVEYNRPPAGVVAQGPVIYETVARRT